MFDRGVPLVDSEDYARATEAGACFRKTVVTRLLEHLPFYLVCWMIALVLLDRSRGVRHSGCVGSQVWMEVKRAVKIAAERYSSRNGSSNAHS